MIQIPDYNAGTRQITNAVMGVLRQKMKSQQESKMMEHQIARDTARKAHEVSLASQSNDSALARMQLGNDFQAGQNEAGYEHQEKMETARFKNAKEFRKEDRAFAVSQAKAQFDLQWQQIVRSNHLSQITKEQKINALGKKIEDAGYSVSDMVGDNDVNFLQHPLTALFRENFWNKPSKKSQDFLNMTMMLEGLATGGGNQGMLNNIPAL